MRGNHSSRIIRRNSAGSIPARAGEPCCPRRLHRVGRGLSPRVRGNHVLRTGSNLPGHRGSIPARAGEPSWSLSGGAWCICGSIPARAGEPRSQSFELCLGPSLGSIPARAGEPAGRCPAGSGAWVYPRACGGTSRLSSLWVPASGLSPRVRGNHRVLLTHDVLLGSIPARAGETL